MEFPNKRGKVITPNIERFELVEHTNFNPRYMITRRIAFNRRYLSNSNWHNLYDVIIQRENAVEWAKRKNATLLAPVSDDTLCAFIELYQDELREFNQLYEESANRVLEIRSHQKKLK